MNKKLLILIAIVATMAISMGTPLDALNNAGKVQNVGEIDLRNANPAAFNSSAFENDNVMKGKHFTYWDDANAEALRSEKANSDWANATTKLFDSTNAGYGNTSPVELSEIVAPEVSVEEFIASLNRNGGN